MDVSGFPEVLVLEEYGSDAHETRTTSEDLRKMVVVPGAKCDTIPADAGENCRVVDTGLTPVAPVLTITKPEQRSGFCAFLPMLFPPKGLSTNSQLY